MITCPNCKTENEAGAIFCDNCGADLRNVSMQPVASEQAAPQAPAPTPQSPQQSEAPAQPWASPAPSAGGVVCPACNLTNVPGAAFCENCGAALPSSSAPAVTPPPAQPQQPVYTPPAPTPQPQQAPQAAPQPTPIPQPPAPAPSVQPQTPGRLVLQASNTSLPIPTGKTSITVGREDPVSGIFPEIDLDPYGAQEAGVSRQHVRLTFQGGQVLVEDLNSANGTLLNRQKLSPNQPHPLQNGDELRLGRLALVYTTG